jgi:hypothetical protein
MRRGENYYRYAYHNVEMHPMRGYEFFVVGGDPWIRIYDRRSIRESLFSLMRNGRFDFLGQNYGCLKRLRPSHMKLKNERLTFPPSSAKYSWNGSEIVSVYRGMEVYVFCADKNEDSYLETKSFSGHSDSVYEC